MVELRSLGGLGKATLISPRGAPHPPYRRDTFPRDTRIICTIIGATSTVIDEIMENTANTVVSDGTAPAAAIVESVWYLNRPDIGSVRGNLWGCAHEHGHHYQGWGYRERACERCTAILEGVAIRAEREASAQP